MLDIFFGLYHYISDCFWRNGIVFWEDWFVQSIAGNRWLAYVHLPVVHMIWFVHQFKIDFVRQLLISDILMRLQVTLVRSKNVFTGHAVQLRNIRIRFVHFAPTRYQLLWKFLTPFCHNFTYFFYWWRILLQGIQLVHNRDFIWMIYFLQNLVHFCWATLLSWIGKVVLINFLEHTARTALILDLQNSFSIHRNCKYHERDKNAKNDNRNAQLFDFKF